MTEQEDIIRMARQAGFEDSYDLGYYYEPLKRFAALIAAAEREACAKVCEELRFSEWGPTPEAKRQRDLCAAAIRARGNA